MVQFAPFSAWRYDLSQVGELSAVTAPAPCLIDDETRERLYERHPCNVVRIVLNRAEPGDQTSHDRHTRADDLLRLWKREGVLIREHDEAIYVCQQQFQHAGVVCTSHSLIGRLRLTAGTVDIAGEAEPVADLESASSAADAAVQERLELIRLTRCQTFPVQAILTGGAPPESDAGPLVSIRELAGSVTPLEVTDDTGTLHRIWPVRDRALIQRIQSRLRPCRAVITSGGDQFAAVVRFRSEVPATGTLQGDNDPANFVLACLMSEFDAGVLTLPGDSFRSRLAPLSGLVFYDTDL